MGLFALGCLGVFLSWGCTEVFRRSAFSKKHLDLPNERSLHTNPTPRGGGIGIVLVVLFFGTVLQFGLSRGPGQGLSAAQAGLVMGGSLLIAVISWLDDFRKGMPPSLRLAVHAAAALMVVLATGGWSHLGLPIRETMTLQYAGYLLAIVWTVGLVNAYNFMDGIDGLAATQTVTAALGWLVIGIIAGSPFLAAAGVLLASSAIGFLIHNWPPAKVFMGDVGSAFLGFCFAAMPFCAAKTTWGLTASRLPIAGFLMVAPFVIDASFTFIRRLIKREKLSQAHRSHLYQRLVVTGLSHGTVTLIYMILGLLGGFGAVLFVFLTDRVAADIIAIMVGTAIFLIPMIWVISRERRASSRA